MTLALLDVAGLTEDEREDAESAWKQYRDTWSPLWSEGSLMPPSWFTLALRAVMVPLRSDHNVFFVGSPRPFAWLCGRYGVPELGLYNIKR